MSLNWNPEVIQVLLGGVLSLVGWAVKRALSRLDDEAKRITDIELALARDYVKHNNLTEIKREQRRMSRMLGHIQLQLVALAARLSVRVEPFDEVEEEEMSVAA